MTTYQIVHVGTLIFIGLMGVALYNAIVGESGVLGLVGGLAWITAVIAAAVAVRRAGAPVLATVLLGLSLVVISHPPPIGPIGLACFAGAVLVLYRSQRGGASRTAQTDRPTPSTGRA